MDSYEEKQEARRQRYLNRAAVAASESQILHSKAHQMASCIPFGQPILVGHHSEQRDRNFRNKIHNTFEKAFDAQGKADYYRDKAESVGKGGISSDDPDAIKKLKEKLAGLEAAQATMKQANALIRKKDMEGLESLGFSQEQIQKLLTPDFAGRIGFAPSTLSNNNANIRSVRQRIVQLERAAQREDKEIEYEGFTYKEEDNRAQFIFPDKPKVEVRKLLEDNSFKWSRSRSAWVRMLNGYGKYAAARVIEKLTAK